MTTQRVTGESWNCPHCNERILRSAVTCPACNRHLRFEALAAPQPAGEIFCPLAIDGTIRHPDTDTPWEYSVLIEVVDGGGETVARRVIDVGAMKAGESRTVKLRMQVLVPEKAAPTMPSS